MTFLTSKTSCPTQTKLAQHFLKGDRGGWTMNISCCILVAFLDIHGWQDSISIASCFGVYFQYFSSSFVSGYFHQVFTIDFLLKLSQEGLERGWGDTENIFHPPVSCFKLVLKSKYEITGVGENILYPTMFSIIILWAEYLEEEGRVNDQYIST